MNLFYLDLVAATSARYHNDKHVVKLILEATQLLYSTWHLMEPSSDWKLKAPNPMKLTHTNHPLTKWVRTNNKTYDIVSDYCHSLLQEYTTRYGKIHSCKTHMDFLTNNYPSQLPTSMIQAPIMPLCMPDIYKVTPTNSWSDVVSSYRNYYIGEKLHFSSYKGVEWPSWLPPKSQAGTPTIVKKKKAPKASKPTTTTTTTTTTKISTATSSKKVKKTKSIPSPSSSPPPPTQPSSFVPAVSTIKTRSQSKRKIN
ncbi:hypothetical protein ACTFIW_001348 [Dictyostelium discoideum]